MQVDSYIELLLRKWGQLWYTIYLGYPLVCPACRDYRPKGYREEANDIDSPEVDRLGEFMSENISITCLAVLRVRYRQKIRNKRKAAKYMGLTERKYCDYFKDAIDIIHNRFITRK